MAEAAAVFKISVDSAQAVQAIADYSRKIEELKEEEKALREEIKKSGTQTDEQAKTLVRITEQRKAYSRALQESSKELQNNMRDAQAQEGSLRALRAQLSNVTKQYDELSRAERNSAKGKELKDKINEITDELKGAEEETQRYYRNVGNYPKALSGVFGATAVAAAQSAVNIQMMVKAGGGAIPTFKAMGKAATTALGPIGIIVMAVVAVFKLFQNAINGSEDASNKAKEAFAFLKKAFDNVMKAVEVVAKGFIWLISGIGKLIGAITGAESATSRYNEAIKEQNRLVKENRALNERSADAELELAKLRDKASDKSTYSAKQRLEFLKEANEKERKLAEERYTLAKREYENLKELNGLTQSTKEDNDKLSEAYVKMRKEETAYYNKKKELNAQIAEASNQIIAEAKAAAEAQKKIRENELADIEAAVDAMLDLYEDGYVKETALANAQYRRKKASLEKRLREEKDLTVRQRKAINDQIEALSKSHEKELTRIHDEEMRKRQETVDSLAQRITDLNIDLMAEGVDKEIEKISLSAERAMLELDKNLQTNVTRLTNLANEARNAAYSENDPQERDNLLARAEEADKALIEIKSKTYEALALLEQKRLNDIGKLLANNQKAETEKAKKEAAEKAKKEAEQEELSWQNKIEAAKQKNEDWLQLELQWKKAELDALHKLEGESEEEFRARQLKAQKAYADAQKAITDKRWADYAKEVDKWDAMGGAIGSLGQIVEQFGEDSREAAIASKAIALGEIAVQTGVAIAKGISAAAAAGPFPANLAAMLTTVATVLSNISSATSIVKSAAFATGGYVSGPGTGTSDSIPARLSNGESVLNARATSMFAPILSPLNQMGGGIPIVATQSAAQVQGEEMLARAFAKGMSSVNISVGVDEITRVQNRVKVIERLGAL